MIIHISTFYKNWSYNTIFVSCALLVSFYEFFFFFFCICTFHSTNVLYLFIIYVIYFVYILKGYMVGELMQLNALTSIHVHNIFSACTKVCDKDVSYRHNIIGDAVDTDPQFTIHLSGERVSFRRKSNFQEKEYLSGERVTFRRKGIFQEKEYLSGERVTFRKKNIFQEKD